MINSFSLVMVGVVLMYGYLVTHVKDGMALELGRFLVFVMVPVTQSTVNPAIMVGSSGALRQHLTDWLCL